MTFYRADADMNGNVNVYELNVVYIIVVFMKTLKSSYRIRLVKKN